VTLAGAAKCSSLAQELRNRAQVAAKFTVYDEFVSESFFRVIGIFPKSLSAVFSTTVNHALAYRYLNTACPSPHAFLSLLFSIIIESPNHIDFINTQSASSNHVYFRRASSTTSIK
jgi:hypothetical protein